jgi:hypothetical protein
LVLIDVGLVVAMRTMPGSRSSASRTVRGFVDLFVGEADIARADCFPIGSSALTVVTNLTPLLRSIVFISKPVAWPPPQFRARGLASDVQRQKGTGRCM